jgi:fumarate reductase subunit D
MAKLRLEPFFWLLFSGGGMFAALLMPVLLFLFGVAFPLGLIAPPDYAHLLAVLSHPLTRLVLLALCVLSLFHWAHRFRYTVVDALKIKDLDMVITPVCYLVAAAGSVVAVYLIWQVP